MKYNNPILPGFYPDPSICRAGEDYYLVTSSFEYFPGVPLFHSRDLVHWEQIGHCLTRRSQLEIVKGFPSVSGIFAPTIRFHNNRFYMITTNKALGTKGGGNFFVYTDDIYGEWSDPVWIDHKGIDPSLFFDDDGKVYYTGAWKGIYQCEIDIETGKRLNETRLIWSGSGGCAAEGPHLYKINGVYYLLIAEGGTSYGHMVTIARSKNPYGPFEECERNPILTHSGKKSPIQATGHADMIQAHNGSWWAICLGIRPVPFPDAHHLGRETFLTPVKWADDGWPIFGDNGMLLPEMEAECLLPVIFPEKPARDNFDSDKLDLQWNFIRNPNVEDWSLSEKKGFLTLHGSERTLEDHGSPAFIGRRLQHFNCHISTLLEFDPVNDGNEAGLTMFLNGEMASVKNGGHHYEIALTRINNKKSIIFRRRIGSIWMIDKTAEYSGNTVVLGIEASYRIFSFYYMAQCGKPVKIGEGETHYLSSETGGGFTGLYTGMYATGNGKRLTAPANFDWFEYLPVEDPGLISYWDYIKC